MPKSKPTNSPIKKSAITHDVMSAIKSGQVTMKPKAYFIIGSIVLGGSVALAAVITILFIGAVIFHLRTQNPLGFLRYGAIGGPVFFHLFPWKALLVAIVGILGGLALLKKYDISYKRSFAGISMASIGALIVLALILDRVGVGERLRSTRPLAPLYRQKFVQDNAIMGEVITASTSAITIKNPQSEDLVTIVWNENTILPQGADFKVGSSVGAIGEFKDDLFVAKGIHQAGMRWKGTGTPHEEINERMPMLRKRLNR